MAKFRKKPGIIEAEQFWPDKPLPFRDAGAVAFDCSCEMFNQSCPLCRRFWVETIHGSKVPLDPGDWVIPEPDGIHFYPCKPDIFAATYEPVEAN